MTNRTEQELLRRIKHQITFFMVALILSGITAFPIETGLRILSRNMTSFSPGFQNWIGMVYTAVKNTNAHYPYLIYGTDWLAFAHIVIATAFIGPLKDPVRNIWVVQFGMIACVMVFPLALIAGPIRGIPFYWQLIDCSFGVFGLAVLYRCYANIRKLEVYVHNRNSAGG